MDPNAFFALAALIALVPAAVVGWRHEPSRDTVFIAVLAVAVAGPLAWVASQTSAGWETGLSAALWVTVAATMVLFAALALINREAWRLTPLLAPYMVALAVLASVWQRAPQQAFELASLGAWVQIHIAASVVTYALVTIAAIAALAAFIQERALKSKRPTTVSRRLPSVADCERQVVGLLVGAEIVLAIGLMTGAAALYRETGAFLAFDHKTVLTISGFVVIGGLLIAHFRSGVRGRAAARMVLLAYLLITLGYPGVKFVTQMMIG
ncbi:MAG: cytochrome c biogenesis protein CcsA [Rhodospirillales bacterium]|jgi:ABC-type uncharacterized transport system permease subunit|nr:cytochrome c biogenesis protein CcsA [Rhodospirillales bacterium]